MRQGVGPLYAEAAQLRVLYWFREDFLRRSPNGIVISELGYMGRTTGAPKQPGPLRTPGRPGINEVLDAMTSDFRRWLKDRDYRKCDVLGIADEGRYAELLEVTTEDNAASAITQIASKFAILRETVNRLHNMSVDWTAAKWRPAMHQIVLAAESHP